MYLLPEDRGASTSREAESSKFITRGLDKGTKKETLLDVIRGEV
jgi:hypothetical protein